MTTWAGFARDCAASLAGRTGLAVRATFMWFWGVQDEVSHHRRRYRLSEFGGRHEAGFEVERTLRKITFLPTVFLIRMMMRVAGLKLTAKRHKTFRFNGLCPHSGGESTLMRFVNLPVGVSGWCVARVADGKPGH